MGQKWLNYDPTLTSFLTGNYENKMSHSITEIINQITASHQASVTLSESGCSDVVSITLSMFRMNFWLNEWRTLLNSTKKTLRFLFFWMIRKVARQSAELFIVKPLHEFHWKTKIKNVRAPGGPFLSCFAKHLVWTFGFFVIIRVIQTSILEPFKTFLLCLNKFSHWSPTNLCDIDF